MPASALRALRTAPAWAQGGPWPQQGTSELAGPGLKLGEQARRASRAAPRLASRSPSKDRRAWPRLSGSGRGPPCGGRRRDGCFAREAAAPPASNALLVLGGSGSNGLTSAWAILRKSEAGRRGGCSRRIAQPAPAADLLQEPNALAAACPLRVAAARDCLLEPVDQQAPVPEITPLQGRASSRRVGEAEMHEFGDEQGAHGSRGADLLCFHGGYGSGGAEAAAPGRKRPSGRERPEGDEGEAGRRRRHR